MLQQVKTPRRPKKARSKRLKGAPEHIWRIQYHKNFWDCYTVWTTPEYDFQKEMWYKNYASFNHIGDLCTRQQMVSSLCDDSSNQIDWMQLPEKIRHTLIDHKDQY